MENQIGRSYFFFQLTTSQFISHNYFIESVENYFSLKNCLAALLLDSAENQLLNLCQTHHQIQFSRTQLELCTCILGADNCAHVSLYLCLYRETYFVSKEKNVCIETEYVSHFLLRPQTFFCDLVISFTDQSGLQSEATM